eukprot:TRINITY_DN3421_c0_g3_i2.p1 TRINITY_DN3421_c0_g3~~TRINITY_DN3421_c0_g3_i2.p1  ORF type:complete len:478 (+),score=184.10 TRINITY_DN3421_c0_g3_i2:164-1597(+)
MDFVRTLRAGTAIGAKQRAESRRKTQADQRRDKVRKLLTAKYQKKFGKSVPTTVIADQVNRFLDSVPPTSHNLEALEGRIATAGSKVRGKSVTKTPAHKPRQENLDALSDFKKNPANRQASANKIKDNYYSTGDSSMPMTEDDEWAAITKYNNQLYQEEMRQEQTKKERQKRHLRYELDRQIKEKRDAKRAFEDEERSYLDYEKEAMRQQEEAEKQKERERKEQRLSEQQLRDKQRREDVIRKEMEESEERMQEQIRLERMRREVELERRAEQERKQIQRETLTKMKEESMKIREHQRAREQLEREQDLKRQQRQMERDEMEERGRRENTLRKDERNRALIEMAMKTGGGQAQREEAEMEEKRLAEQRRVLEQRQDDEEEIKMLIAQETKRNMREALKRQVEEHRRTKELEKGEDRIQAEMWRRSEEAAKKQEEANAKVIKDMNRRNQDYIMNQMITTKQARAVSYTHLTLPTNREV